MTSPVRGRLAGTVRWAVVPYAPRPPFRLYAGWDQAPIVVENTETILASARRGEAELTYLVPGKARPVLVLNDPPAAHHPEVAALRLLRVAKLDAAAQAHVREHRDPLLFHLDPARFDLPEENAVMVTALVRLHVEAVDATSCGELEPGESRLLGERLIEFYGFDTRLLVERTIRALAARQRRT